ncbi:hypothetical protein STCU_02968 [Strigomonas culicis]|uniref:Uncharacterized protein n=1 Tax=Strigomonas culicis TaxID=28005 RepID=S9VKL5_9TRYP|nr:hypothetical protein STCU_05669 [Strigomonas culicis]EPY32116.1 hypothetical protein STCU_02968 [Strigomonas culicis]|eukprot:EPY27601.1 hypothetical protein STCU_05669 [Strigomonas culicis]
MLRRCLPCRRRWFIRTPFDCQPMEVATTPSFSNIMGDLVPHKDLSRQDELKLLLERLPAKCDEAKETLLDAQRASRYYRKRFKRGMETQRRHAQRAVAEASDAQLADWAVRKCREIRNPLDI